MTDDIPGLLKKKKKVKTSPPPKEPSPKDSEPASSSSKAAPAPVTSDVAEKAVDGPPASTSTAALSAVGA